MKEQVVLTRSIVGEEHYDTYYRYDYSGNLCMVLPPIFSTLAEQSIKSGTIISLDPNSDAIKKYCYVYEYDAMRRCTMKKLPGIDPTYYIYDAADQLIFTQDGEQRKRNTAEWTFTLPDIFGRPVLVGIVVNNNIKRDMFLNTSTAVRASYTGGSSNLGYTISGFSINPNSIYSVNYYDNYDFLGKHNIPNNTNTQYVTKTGYDICYGDHQPANKSKNKGLLKGTLISQYLPNGALPETYLYSVMYYDYKGQLVQTKSSNHLGGTEEEYIAYNFVGQPTKKLHIHSATGKTTQTELYTYSYDHAGRLLDTKHKLNAESEILIATNTYNELGRLKNNKKGNNANLATTYAYNIRLWTNQISSPHFVENLSHTYSGNVKAMDWTLEGKTRKYDFVYDNLSRLTAANYYGDGNYSSKYEYDKHGNMLYIERYGNTAKGIHGLIDKITINYNGNQMKNATDAAPKVNMAGSADFKDYANKDIEYLYNVNGAMTKDLNKGIGNISYNLLNLPTKIDIKNPVGEARNEYTYSAGGQKLKVVQKWNPAYSTTPIIGSDVIVNSLTASKTTDYVGNKIYENGNLKRILIDGGYIEGGKYHYYITDHLGSNRAVAQVDNNKETIIQRTHYYPFGMAFGESTGQEEQPYKFTDKELDTMHGLDVYDSEARVLSNGSIPGFLNRDPLAEKKPWLSPYIYCSNNPLNRIDPDGRDDYFNSAGEFARRTAKGSNIYVNIGDKDVLLSDVNVGSQTNYAAVSNVVEWYGKTEAGVSFYMNGVYPVGNDPKGTLELSTKRPDAFAYT